MRNLLVALGFSALSFAGFTQNNCNTAVSIDPIPADAACPGSPDGSGTTPLAADLSTVTPSNPYTYVPDCNGVAGNDMELFGNDLWFSFTATANILEVNLTNMLGITEANVGFYTGTCAQLIGLGCSVGAPTGGAYTAVLEPLTPGDTYYIQVSGAFGETGTFNISVANNLDCNDCLTGSNLTVTPAPVAGTYQPGETVTFCYTVTDYAQVSSNWFHGVELTFGAGWDQSTLIATPPASCSGSGVWGYYASVTGFSGTYGPGFFYDYNGFPSGAGDGNPGNNFGDLDAEDCNPQFCWTITADNPAICDPANPPSLDVDINTLADGESGSWSSVACTDDPITNFSAIIACCNPPATSSTPVSCPGLTDGTVTATVPGTETLTGNYYFSFYDANGTLVYTETVAGTAGNPVTSTTSGLPEGDYTVVVSNPVNCAATAVETIDPPAGSVTAVVPANVLVCVGDDIGPLVFDVTPADPDYEFDWTMTADVGAGTSGTVASQINTFASVNAGASIIVSTVTVTPQSTTGGCPGVPETFTITVNPAPIITLTPTPGTTVCAGEPVDLEACYTPAPLGVPVIFTGSAVDPIDGGSGGNPSTPDSGTNTVSTTGLEPATMSPGTLESICFTLQMDDPSEIDEYITIEVNGVVYSSSATLPAGSVFNADLLTVFNAINTTPANAGNGQVPPVTQTYCVPQGFLDLIDATGGNSNTSWILTVYGNIGGGSDASILDFEVEIDDVTPYTYNWTPTGTITTGSTSGTSFGECHTVTISTPVDETYTFDILDNTGCTGTATVDITVTPGPTATMTTGSAEYCEEDAAATGIDIDVALTGIPDWTIVYDTDGNLGTTGDQVTVSGISTSPYTITNATAGTYQLVSVADQGCPGGVVSGTYTVTENPTPVLSVPADICAGGLANTSTTITADGTPASPTAWSIVGGTGSATLTNADQNTVTVTGTGAGTVILEYINDNNCSEQVTVTIDPLPVPVASNSGPVCFGQSFTVTETGGDATSWSWTPSGTATITNGTDQTPTVTGAVDGEVFTVVITDANNCSDQTTTTIVINDLPVVTPVSDFTVCSGIAGNVNVGLTSDQDPDVSFDWVVSNAGPNVTGGAAGSGSTINQTLTNSGASPQTIDYEVTATNTVTNCGSVVMTFTVTVDPTPTISGVAPICAGGLSNTTVDLTGSGTPAASPAWVITGGSGAATLTNEGTNTVTVTGTSAGTVDIQYTDANGCFVSTTITVNSIPVPTATNGGPYCVDGTILLDAEPTGQTSYSWTGPNVYTSATEDPSLSPATLAMAGDYTVVVTDVNGCSDQATTTVVVNPLPTAVITGTNTICDGQSTDLTFTLTGTGDFDVVYTDGVSNFTLNNINDGHTVSVSPSATTTYTLVSVLDNGTTCSGTVSGTATVTVTPLPVATISNAAGPVCAGEDAVFTITGDPGATVTYTLDGGATNPTVILDGSGNATITVGTTAPSDADVVMDLVSVQLGACSDILSDQATIVVNDLPVYIISAAVSPTDCVTDNGSITLSGLDPNTVYDLTYDGPSGTVGPTSITTDGAGDYLISLLSAGGYDNFIISNGTCQNILLDPQTLVPPGAPDFTIALGQDPTTCTPGNDGEIIITGVNLNATYNYELTYSGPSGVVGPTTITTDGSGNYTLTGLTEGSYSSISIEDPLTSCVGAQAGPIVLTNPVDPAVSAATVPTSVCSDNNTFVVQETGGAANISWSWSSDGSAGIVATTDQNPTVTNAANGEIFTVEVTDNTTQCTNSATTTITVVTAPFAGADNSAALCNVAGSTLDLNTLLEAGATGGVWLETTASGQFNTVTGLFDASGLTPQNYTFTYTVAGVAPCIDDVATFTVNVTGVPDAGADNSDVLCNSTGSTIDLNTLLDVGVIGGTWSETTGTPSGQFNTVTGVLDGSGLTAGGYTFLYDIPSTATCPGDQAIFTVTISNQETAGLDDLTLTLCNSAGSTIDLNTVLSGNTVAGTWAETTASGQFNVGTGVFDANGLTGGNAYDFTYTVNSTSPCVADIADFTVTISNQETAGLDDLTLTLCNSTGSTIDLNTALNGNTVAGTWVETTASGQFTPGTGVLDGSGLTAGQYNFTYTVNSTAPCVADVADFTVTISNQETAGLDDLTLTLCNSAGSTIDLNTVLNGNTVAGTWAETTASGQFNIATGVFDASGLTGGNAYDFTYTVNSTSPCVADIADFTVTISNQEAAGLDDLTLTLCNSTGSTIDLNTALSGNTIAGTWAETTASGQFTPGTGVLDGSGLTAGQYNFTYTVNSIAPCVADVADFTVTISNQETAGLDDLTLTLCNSAGSTIDLNTALSGNTVAGTWAETTASGQFTTGTGVLDGNGLTAGQYNFTYTVNSTSPCVTDLADFTVTISNQEAAGLDDLTLTLCNSAGSTIDLNTALNGNTVAGTWAETTASGQFTPGTGVLDGSGLTAGQYNFTYTVNSTAPCVADLADFTVTISNQETAGLDDLTLTLCNSAGSTIDLNTALSGNTVAGTWAETTASGQFTPGTGVLDGNGLTAGQYNFTYTVNSTAPCVADVADFTVTINATPTLTVQDTTDCSPFTVDLTDVTYWSADVGTLSYFESDGVTPIANASSVGAGDYVIQADNLGCIVIANVVVTEVTTPVVDPLGPISECDSYTLPVITGTSLSGTEAYYTGMGGTGTQFNSGDAVTTSGLTTLYIYDGAAGCSDEEQLDITITVTPTITAVDPAEVCEPNTVDISGAASADVGTLTWYTDASLTTPVVDPTQVSTGMYYAEADNNGCASSDFVNVTVNPLPPAPTAGTDSTYCTSWTLENMTATGTGGTLNWYLDTLSGSISTGGTYAPGTDLGTTMYYVTETLLGCEGPASMVSITIEECDITIPTAITPNSDLNNDDWEILSLDAVYPDNTVRVFNRWGNLIFEHISTPSAPYDQNRWDGTYDGDVLPVGSYYYVIELNDEDGNVETGSVSIVLD